MGNRKVSSDIRWETYDGELNIGLPPFIDVFHPLMVRLKAVGGETNNFHIALRKVRLAAGDLSELSGADRSKVIRVREENSLNNDQSR